MSAPLYEDSRVEGFFMSPWRMGMPASSAEDGTVAGLEAEMMSWEGGMRFLERIYLRTPPPSWPEVPVRTSIVVQVSYWARRVVIRDKFRNECSIRADVVH